MAEKSNQAKDIAMATRTGRKPVAARAGIVTAYAPSEKSFMSSIPKPLLPYAQLVRLDKPGFVYFLFPHVSGALLAATIRQAPPMDVARALMILLVGSVFLTFVNYAWNDVVDADFDARVSRTKHRPVARGAISRPVALAFTAALASASAGVLAWLPSACMVTALPLCAGAFVYPLSKRWTNFPQLVFGPVIASGVFMGAASLGISPMATLIQEAWTRELRPSSWEKIFCGTENAPLWLLFAANAAWAIFYELIYSFQDMADDAEAGVGTMTLLIMPHPKPVLGALAGLAVALLGWTGIVIEASVWFYVFTVAATSGCLAVKLHRVEIKDPRSCIWWFAVGGMVTGGIMNAGILANYVARIG